MTTDGRTDKRPRRDNRYEATVSDVVWALRARAPDPFGHNQRPKTDFEIAGMVAYDRGLVGALGYVLKRNRLLELLAEMAERGVLVGRPRCEWAAMGREAPSRAKDPLYTTPELAEAWAAADAAEARVAQPEG
ncbi:hypothetical protein [Streptomyces sp. NPDC059278]|uniref:hypothetical protein n=1 Tax=Streptomyces sp. NPDC059278 TaxID=3346801 RepID=UPI0036CEFAE0